MYDSQEKKHNLKSVVNFLFEAGSLANTPRSYTVFLGSGRQSVAEHTMRMAYIGLAMALLDGQVNIERVLSMCLLHDLAEARTGDLNYVNQKYTSSDEHKVIKELMANLEFGDNLLSYLNEFTDRNSREAQLAKDADQLDFIMSLKEQADLGNARAEEWIPSAVARLKTDLGKELALTIMTTKSDEWWFKPDDEFWVDRGGADMSKRW